ncbi:MAG: tRNA uridine-5-carboxymethylaminomethyl(34) synthesis GTPase MnmE [Brevinematales bacterium]|nr:tRNA uridine-5-carboxymethylaminomethyl(34) synthesis GTPase MnmE [Brevinematales bacterium]
MTATSGYNQRSTIVALATPLGESAIGVLRLSGKEAFSLAECFYRGRTPWQKIVPRYASLGFFVDPRGEVLDEGIWIKYPSPASYTGEDMVEIMLHGNPWLLLEAQRHLIAAGAQPAKPGEFTERAYLNGKMDLSQAEAVNDLIRAHTRLAKSAALSQLQGKLSHVIEQIHRDLLDLLARVEAAIDHSDIEETYLSQEYLLSHLQKLTHALENLLHTARAGQILRLGIKVAIVGAPNVGKSSLFNLLAQEDRAIVTDIPGTTRDTLEVEIQIKDVPFRLIDTAGIHESTDIVEQEGIRRSQRAIDMADLCIALFDGSRPPTEEDTIIVNLLKDKPCLFVINKVEEPHYAQEYTFLPDPLWISVKNHWHIDTLHEKLAAFYYSMGYNPQADVLLTNQRQETLVRQAHDAISQAIQETLANTPEEYIAHHLFKAKHALEEIVGKTTHEALLDRIFSQFCIGK